MQWAMRDSNPFAPVLAGERAPDPGHIRHVPSSQRGDASARLAGVDNVAREAVLAKAYSASRCGVSDMPCGVDC
jgi:hypothetical protein